MEQVMDAKFKTSLSAVLAGIFLFVVSGAGLIVGEIPIEWGLINRMSNSIRTILFIAPIFIFPIFMCVGWIISFPRWSYPYVVHVIVFSLYISNASTPGFKLFGYEMFGRELWGWRAWIPLMVIALIALGMTRSFRPIARFFTNIRDDWTLLTFGMFGFMPLVIAIMFDEVDRLFSLYFMVILAIILIGTAFAYMISAHHRRRAIALLIGISLSLVIPAIAPNIYWNSVMDANVIPGLGAGVIVFLFMFAPSLLGLRQKQNRSV